MITISLLLLSRETLQRMQGQERGRQTSGTRGERIGALAVVLASAASALAFALLAGCSA